MDRKLALTILLNGVDKLSGPLRNIVGLGERSGQALGRLTRAARAADRELADLRRELSGASGNVTELINRERELEAAVARANGAVERQRRVMAIDNRVGAMHQQADRAIAAGQQNVVQGGAILAPFILATKGAMEFSSGMVDLQQKAELTNAEMIRMRASILAASRATHQLPEDMRAAVDVLAGFGMDPRQAVLLTEPIGRLGTAMKVDLADAAAAAYSNINNLKVPIGETARAFDIMAAAGNAGAFEIRDMARWFPQLTAQARALGQEGTTAVADLSAALQIARRGAGSADQAANNVANLLAKINSAETIRKFQQHFGVDLPAALDAAYAKGKTPLEAIAELANQATGGDLRKLAFIVEDQQAQSALRSLILDMEDYRKIRSDIASSGGTVDSAFDQRVLNDGMVAWKAFKVQLSGTALTLGTKLLPVASQFLTIVGGMATAVGEFAERNPELTTGLLYLVAGTGAAKIALGGLQLAFGGILKPAASAWGVYQKWKAAGSVAAAFPTVAKGFTLLRTAALFMASGLAKAGALMLANPVVLAVTAIALGIGAAAYLIYNHWDTIKAAFSAAGEWLGEKVRQYPLLFGPLGIVANLVMDNWAAISGAFSRAGQWLMESATWIGSTISSLFMRFTPLGIVVDMVRANWGSITTAFMTAGEWIAGFAGRVGGSLSTLASAVSAPLRFLAQIATSDWATIKAAFVAGVGGVKAYFAQLPGWFQNIGRMMMAGLLASINPAALGARLIAMAKNGVAAFKNYLGIRSPSRLFAEMGGFMTEGLAIGLDRGAPRAVGAARRIALASAAAMTITAPAPTLAEPEDPRRPMMEALRIQSAIAAPALPSIPQPDALAIGAGIETPRAPRLPAMDALRILSTIAAPALPRLPQPEDVAIGTSVAAPEAPRLPAMDALRILSTIAAPALPRLPQPEDVAIGTSVAAPVMPQIPALGRARLPVDLDIIRQLQMPEALMRVIPQLAQPARAEAEEQLRRPLPVLAAPARPGRGGGDGTEPRGMAPSAGLTLNISIQQQPGEDAELLARRVADLIDQRVTRSRLGAFRDE